MNYMEKVAKMLGVELGEIFEIYRCDGCYCLTYSGLIDCQSGFDAATMLSKLLSCEYHIKHKPWKPKYDEYYYHVGASGYAYSKKWYNDIIDIPYYKIGNCYRTKEAAEANRDKWMSFYASDEVLEV